MLVTDLRPAKMVKPVQLFPVALSAVPAGFASPAQDYFNGDIDLNEHLISDAAATYIVRVSGHSMVNAGISDGDELIIDRSIEPEHGDVVVAVIDGELTVKRLNLTPKGVILKAENPEYPDIEIHELADFTIWGVATRCLHRL